MQVFVRACLETSPAPGDCKAKFRSRRIDAPEQPDMQLHVLKRRILWSALEEASDLGLSKRLCGAANRAADMAWSTPAPALTFPGFFEDLAREILSTS